MQLNPEQEAVASHVHGRIVALAGPGSGKTRTLTERTARLIRSGVQPGRILCLTFTNKARDEMRQRIAAACGPAAEKVFISNFHGLCGIILRKMGAPLGYGDHLTIIDADDQVDLIQQIARAKGIEATRPAARALAAAVNDWREGLGSERDLDAMVPNRMRRPELSILRAYVQRLRQRNQCDFSGMLSETVRLLREQEPVRRKLQEKFHFIQVDEYQDTNRAQNELVELIAGASDNVLAVGDGDQSIYEWRGASTDGIPRFIEAGQRKTGRCVVAKLGCNYRSSPQIIACADRLIRHSSSRIAVDFTTIRPDGEAPKCGSFKNPEEEADAVAGGIQNLIRDGVPAKEIAVFYRANDMSRLIEQSLAKRHIPFQVIGGGSYYDRMEVRDVLAMLRFLCNPRDGIAFARIANKPPRGMGDTLLGRLETHAEAKSIDLLAAMADGGRAAAEGSGKPLTPAAERACREAHRIFSVHASGRNLADIAQEIVRRTEYDRYLQERYEGVELESRRRNVNELLNSIAGFSRANPRAGLADYLQSIALYTEADDLRDQDSAVRLMSLHASKGLEFDVVYIIGVEAGILPHARAVEERPERGLEEERRLCYVGFTRARRLLRVTWCQARQDVAPGSRSARYRPARPSPFLLESGLMSREAYEAAVQAGVAAKNAKRA